MESEKIHGGTFKQWFQMIETSTARFSAMTQSTRSDKPAHVKQEKWDSENWDVTIVTYPATQQTHFQVTPGEDGKTVKIASAKLFDYMQTFHHFESDHDEYMNKALHLGLQNGYDVVVIQATRKQNATTKNAMLSVAFGSEIDVTEDYPLHKSYVQQMLQTKTLDYMISNSTGSYGFVIPELSIHQSMMYLDPEPIIKKEKHLLERSWQGMLASFFGIQFDPIVISTQIQGAQVINNYAWEDKHPFEQTIQTLFNYGFDYHFGKAFFRS